MITLDRTVQDAQAEHTPTPALPQCGGMIQYVTLT